MELNDDAAKNLLLYIINFFNELSWPRVKPNPTILFYFTEALTLSDMTCCDLNDNFLKFAKITNRNGKKSIWFLSDVWNWFHIQLWNQKIAFCIQFSQFKILCNQCSDRPQKILHKMFCNENNKSLLIERQHIEVDSLGGKRPPCPNLGYAICILLNKPSNSLILHFIS